MSFKVRFNLGRGENFQKWRVTNNLTKESFYVSPEKFNLELTRCKLKNQKGTAKKIYSGSNKTVCAWVHCEEVLLTSPIEVEGISVRYNPREAPNWVFEGENADKKTFEKLTTYNRNIIWVQ